uniref:zinc finger MYM-type protein 1-like n=1 Tax=Styela clava TaxID=7725 RepID=UPI001939D71E|nr:zinc finger MYM-type protein 1-like [Styela clava]
MSQTNKQAKKFNCYLKLPEKRLIASYKVAHLLAKRKKAHTDAESVIAPALAIVVEERIQPSGAQYRRKKRRREAEYNVLRSSLDAWVKKQHVAKNQLGDENHESVTVVQDDVSIPVNTHLDIVRDNQSHNSIPDDADDFDEVSANSEASAVILNDDAEGNNNDGNFIELFRDHDLWRLRKPISTHLVKFLVQQEPEKFEHKEGTQSGKTQREGRSLSKHWFETLSSNRKCLQRKWLIYSSCKQASFCFVCFLFSKCESSFCNEKGFRSWRKLNPRIYKHEKSPGHRNAKREYLDFGARLEKLRVIDYELQRHISSEKKKWRLDVERIVNVVFLLSRQNIAFRRHRDEGVSKLVKNNAYENNSGNFLEIIGLLADYDVVLFEHLQNARKNPNKVNYLSNKSQNEIINLIAGIIKKKNISEVKKAKYYTVMLDSTPDISREDEIAEILRYFHISENKDVEIKEVFLGVFQVSEKNAASSVETVIEKLNDDGIDINDCRGQAYNNAAVMSGVRTGVQKRILEINPQAQIEDLSSDIKDQVREHFVAKEDELSVLWALQVDESTDRTGKAHLLAFIRFIKDVKLVNECSLVLQRIERYNQRRRYI